MSEAICGNNIVLQMQDIVKIFPGVKALDRVSFDLRAGEVHALVGENGAGKSTLMKILAGAYHPDEGEIILQGSPVHLRTPKDAREKGINIVYQELNLIPKMSVTDNIFLGNESVYSRIPFLVNRKKMARDVRRIFAQIGLDLPPNQGLDTLGIAQQQLVEIAKVINRECSVLALDEPTSALSGEEIEKLFKIITNLKKQGIGIIYISHKLDEIFRLADRITILRDGKRVKTVKPGEISQEELVSLMIGRKIDEYFPKETVAIGKEIFRVENLTHKPTNLNNISFQVKKGEIVGIYGLMGAGKTELAHTIFGAAGPIVNGRILINGQQVLIRSTKDAIRAGIGLIPEDRRGHALIPVLSVAKNMTLACLQKIIRNLLISFSKEKAIAEEYKGKLNIATPSHNTPIKSLSGGNQQKVVIARWLFRNSKVFICDEPTRGIDVGAKTEVYKLLTDLAKMGAGIILFSSELNEILGVSDRIIVMHERTMVREFLRNEAIEEKVMKYALGGVDQ
jgi:ribose transport system ATP-binding protein